MPSVMQKIVAMPGRRGLHDRVGGAARPGRRCSEVSAPVSRTASATVSNTGTAAVEGGLAALARGHARDDPCVP